MKRLVGLFALLIMTGTAVADDILIFGGTRNTGLETVKLLVARGDNVTAFVRETSDVTALNELGATLVIGDALERYDFRLGHILRF